MPTFDQSDWIILGVIVIIGATMVAHLLFGTKSRTGGGIRHYSGEFDKSYFIGQAVLFVALCVLLLLDMLGIYSTDNIVSFVKNLSEM